MNILQLPQAFVAPSVLFERVAGSTLSVRGVFFGYALWMGMVPPVCAYVGMVNFGWHFGIGEAVVFERGVAAMVAAVYYLFLLFGFLLVVWLTRWMAPTYGAATGAGLHAALVAIVGTPLMVGGVLHLYPLLPLNLLFLFVAASWSVYLLYTGVPALLGIDFSRGMLMASAILGVLFVACIALATGIMILWVHGLGPDIGFDWRLSVEG